MDPRWQTWINDAIDCDYRTRVTNRGGLLNGTPLPRCPGGDHTFLVGHRGRIGRPHCRDTREERAQVELESFVFRLFLTLHCDRPHQRHFPLRKFSHDTSERSLIAFSGASGERFADLHSVIPREDKFLDRPRGPPSGFFIKPRFQGKPYRLL